MNTFRFNIVTPEKRYLSADVEMVQLNLPDGQYVLLAGHEPVTAALDWGLVTYRTADGRKHEALCGEGFAEMRPDRAVIFTDHCLDADNLDEAEEKIALEKMRAQDQYEQSLVEHHHSAVFLARAITNSKKRRR